MIYIAPFVSFPSCQALAAAVQCAARFAAAAPALWGKSLEQAAAAQPDTAWIEDEAKMTQEGDEQPWGLFLLGDAPSMTALIASAPKLQGKVAHAKLSLGEARGVTFKYGGDGFGFRV